MTKSKREQLYSYGEKIRRAFRADGWQNIMTGLGTTRDKTTYGQFYAGNTLRDGELTAMYHHDDVARRIVSLKPREMLRQGFGVRLDDVEREQALGRKLRELKLKERFLEAMILGRLYGGAAILIGADDGGAANEPLRPEAVRDVTFLHVFDRRYLMPSVGQTLPLTDPNYGEPELYHVLGKDGGGGGMSVHRSRLILFGGNHTTCEEQDRLGGWDHSVLQAPYDALRSFHTAWKAAEHLMTDASQAVFKLGGLIEMIANDPSTLQQRMQAVDMGRSVARAILVDPEGGEDFTRQSSSFTDASAMVDRFMFRIASAAEMPVTILMGRSPAGQNATGDSDFRAFYDTIRTAQENELEPRLERVVSLILGATGGEPEGWSIQFAPLYQMTPHEQADLEKKMAERDALYIDREVVLPEEVALSRFPADGWSPQTIIDLEMRERALDQMVSMPPAEDPVPNDPPNPPDPQTQTPPTAEDISDDSEGEQPDSEP